MNKSELLIIHFGWVLIRILFRNSVHYRVHGNKIHFHITCVCSTFYLMHVIHYLAE